ncbi:polysaccharide biosynthesis protein [bacterium]|nr:polysaccharide biosynthesis protein [bacterium]
MALLDSRVFRRSLLFAIDLILLALAWILSYSLRFEFSIPSLPEDPYAGQMLVMIPWVVGLQLVLFAVFHLYRGIVKYVSTAELRTIIIATVINVGVWSAFNMWVQHREQFLQMPLTMDASTVLRIPYGILGIYFFISIIFVGGLRFLRRIWVESIGGHFDEDAPATLIVGAGDLAENALRDIMRSEASPYRPVCAVTTTSPRVGSSIQGVKVVGTVDRIPEVLDHYEIKAVLIALEEDDPKVLRKVVQECQDAQVAFHIIPTMRDITSGKVDVSPVRRVGIEDLLGREPVNLTLAEDRNYLRGETVLITGAGGSIGSELSRQVAWARPKAMLLLGKGENSIYDIHSELAPKHPEIEFHALVADVRDQAAMTGIFELHRPTIVFHAAAHKHVPLMEVQPGEAVKNNILGTATVAFLAHLVNTKKFVLISTDKAVRPTSVMGATKRIAETIVFSLGERSRTTFQAVRFGNVLGSRGSVIPLFQRQIEAGGPVTVTHPEVTRFFMTIPEAVSLLLQAGSKSESRSLFLLDMGEPVKIADLARNMITLSGLKPGADIEIKYTGLRPGEKLREDLLTKEEGAQATDIGKVWATKPKFIPTWKEVQGLVTEFRDMADAMDDRGIVELLRDTVPDFHPTTLPDLTDREALLRLKDRAMQELEGLATNMRSELGLEGVEVEEPAVDEVAPDQDDEPETFDGPEIPEEVPETPDMFPEGEDTAPPTRPGVVARHQSELLDRDEEVEDRTVPADDIETLESDAAPDTKTESAPDVDEDDDKLGYESLRTPPPLTADTLADLEGANAEDINPKTVEIEKPNFDEEPESDEMVDELIAPVPDVRSDGEGLEHPAANDDRELTDSDVMRTPPPISEQVLEEMGGERGEEYKTEEVSSLDLEKDLLDEDTAPPLPDEEPEPEADAQEELWEDEIEEEQPESLVPEEVHEEEVHDEIVDEEPTREEPDAAIEHEFDMPPLAYFLAVEAGPGLASTLAHYLDILGPDDMLLLAGPVAQHDIPPDYADRVTLIGESGSPGAADWNNAIDSCPIGAIFVAASPEARILPTLAPRLAEAFSREEVAVAYGDYIERDAEGNESLVELQDHAGCPHERFDFGPVIAYRAGMVQAVGKLDEELEFAFQYDLHLRLMQEGLFVRMTEPIAVVPAAASDQVTALHSPGRGPLGGFSYVFYPPEVEAEVTQVFEKALRQIGAWIDQPTHRVPTPDEEPEVTASIVVPVLNREDTIGNAIRSVLEGTYQDFEIIVVDNGSTDQTCDAVAELIEEDHRVRLIDGMGDSIASALNDGIRVARGRYICQLDSDDEYVPETLERMIEQLESNPKCGLAISYYRLIDEEGNVIEDVPPVTHTGYSRNQIVRRDGAGAVRVFPKTVLEEMGLYDEEHYGNFGEDYDMVLKVSERYDVDRVSEVLYHYRRHSGNTDMTRDPKTKYVNKNRARQMALRRRMRMNEER